MRAYVIPSPGQPPLLREVAEPSPGPGEVLVKVSTSSVNPHDLMVVSGAAAMYMTYRYPVVLGTDLSGTVAAAGAGAADAVVTGARPPGVPVAGQRFEHSTGQHACPGACPRGPRLGNMSG